MPLKIYPYNIAREGNEDWPKQTIDLAGVSSAQELVWLLDDLGWTVERYKALPSFTAALESGEYPWLADL